MRDVEQLSNDNTVATKLQPKNKTSLSIIDSSRQVSLQSILDFEIWVNNEFVDVHIYSLSSFYRRQPPFIVNHCSNSSLLVCPSKHTSGIILPLNRGNTVSP